jgi:hypothetical protein
MQINLIKSNNKILEKISCKTWVPVNLKRNTSILITDPNNFTLFLIEYPFIFIAYFSTLPDKIFD